MEFDNVILQIAEDLKRTLMFIPQDVKNNCEEIRLRAGLPVCLTVNTKVFFVYRNGGVGELMSENVLVATKEDVMQTLSRLCKNSIYLHEGEIKQGFVSLPNGCRAGVSGIFNVEGMLVSVSSLNIRIARQVFDCAKVLLPYTFGGLLIAGPPGCGKTTFLRDAVRLLSKGENGMYYRVSVVDSRGEISGDGALDLGINTDVLHIENKALGVNIALRTMSPDFIVFDEIGTIDELESVSNCFNAGVTVITTAHCRDKYELLRRDVTRKIIENGAISNVAILSKKIGENPQIISVGELKNVCV